MSRLDVGAVKRAKKGSLGIKNFNKDQKSAYNSWRDQRHRCRSKKLDCYKYYGGKGIQVKYSSLDFMNWWLEELKSFIGKKPTISRINHDGHYEFGNIKLENHMENCVLDTLRRNGPPSHHQRIKTVIFDYITKEPLMIATSISHAANLTGVAHTNVCAICNNKNNIKSGKGYTFIKYDDWIKGEKPL